MIKKERMITTKNYTYTIDGNIIFIEGSGTGKTVTNSIEEILADITKDLQCSMDNFKIIYRDSEGIIDGVITNKGLFEAFYFIGVTSYYAAKLKI